MKVILQQQLKSFGNIGDVVDVKPGYAKNYLIPRGFAMYATKVNLENLVKNRDSLIAKNATMHSTATSVAEKMNGVILILVRMASDDGHLYGSVTSKDVIAAFEKSLSEAGSSPLHLPKDSVNLGHGIKSIGVYNVSINLYNDVVLDVKLNVCRSEADAENNMKRHEIPQSTM